jgi:hypothetical protein
MAEIVNLSKARKAKARADGKVQAAANRAAFGRSKAEKTADEAARKKAAAALDGALRDPARPRSST